MKTLPKKVQKLEGISDGSLKEASTGAASGEILLDVRFMVHALWRGKWVIVLFAVIGVVMGVRSLRSFAPQYEAYSIVLPAGSGGGSAELNGAASGVAKRFGFSLSQGRPTTVFDRFEVLLGSISFAAILQEKHNVLQEINAGSWDADRQQWIPPTGWRFTQRQKIRSFLKLRTWSPPDVEQLAQYLSTAIRVQDIGDTDFKKISLRHSDRDVALNFLTLVYNEADAYLRDQDRSETETRKVYIQQRLAEVKIADLKVALVSLLTNEERTSMLMAGGLPYVGRIIEPPTISTRRLFPESAAVIFKRLALAIALAGTLVLVVSIYRRE